MRDRTRLMNRVLKALVIEDDYSERSFIASVFRAEGWFVQESKSDAETFLLTSSSDWNLVICELSPHQNPAMDFVQGVLKSSAITKVVWTTSHATALGALNAISSGAFEYLSKPVSLKDLQVLCSRFQQRFNTSASLIVNKPANHDEITQTLIGKSRSFLEIMKQVGRIAPTSLPVLLTGESGTGKEIVAANLHSRSSRHDGPFVALNCGALSTELIEAELFGHEKGSFTGADRQRPGLWDEADGGTIFLDEITETSLSFQVKLLRTIQRGEVRSVGSNKVRHLDVRVIAASNRDVEQEVADGRFRQDLFYRLNAVSIKLPPLRERREDIPLLIEAFQRRVVTETPFKLSSEVMEILLDYPWPGNVRELEHTVMRTAAMCDGIVLPQDLPERVRNHRMSTMEPIHSGTVHEDLPQLSSLANIEADYIKRLLTHTNWNKQAAARILNVDRKTLARKIKRHDITRAPSNSYSPQKRKAA